jgi:hypothetical protein
MESWKHANTSPGAALTIVALSRRRRLCQPTAAGRLSHPPPPCPRAYCTLRQRFGGDLPSWPCASRDSMQWHPLAPLSPPQRATAVPQGDFDKLLHGESHSARHAGSSATRPTQIDKHHDKHRAPSSTGWWRLTMPTAGKANPPSAPACRFGTTLHVPGRQAPSLISLVHLSRCVPDASCRKAGMPYTALVLHSPPTIAPGFSPPTCATASQALSPSICPHLHVLITVLLITVLSCMRPAVNIHLQMGLAIENATAQHCRSFLYRSG